MKTITASQRTQTIEYDFATDGGAVGTLNLPMFFSEKSVFISGFVECVTTLIGGAGTTIDFACQNGNLNIGFFLPIADFSQGANIRLLNFVIISPSTTGYITLLNCNLQIIIGTAPITAGIIRVTLNTTEFPQN